MSTEIKKSTKMLTVDAFVDLALFTKDTVDIMLGRDNDYNNKTIALPEQLSTLDTVSLKKLKEIAQSVEGIVTPQSNTKKDLITPVAGRNNNQERGR